MTLDDAGASSRYYHSHATNSLQLDPLFAQNAAPYANNKSPAIPITPISPVIASAAGDKSILDLGSPSKSHPAGNLPIPPPPNPRRHRSGVLMSRVRANSSGTNFQTGNAIGSKSFGDLNMSMSTMSTGNDEEELEYEEGPVPPWAKRPSKRVVSEGFGRGSDEEDGMWDNSARFYHHMHSRPVSRAASRAASPTQSPSSLSRAESRANSTSTSPIYVRRALTLPQNGKGSSPHSTASLSPNHLFLQQHLPPTFPGEALSPENVHPSHPNMVILTPTTQEWRELKEIRRLEGEDVDSQEDSSSESDESRRSSVIDTSLQSSILTAKDKGTYKSRPGLRSTMSVDFLPKEELHTPDPGSPIFAAEEPSRERPVFNPVVIAPSPVVPESTAVPHAPETPSPAVVSQFPADLSNENAESPPEIDEDDVVAFSDAFHRPVRFNSIGRRESLQAIRPTGRPGVPRSKTKRELEREKLFKELDEELEYDAQGGGAGKSAGVQEIGKGGGLGSRPNSMDMATLPRAPAEINLGDTTDNIFDKGFKMSQQEVAMPKSPTKPAISPVSNLVALPRPHNPSLSPTQPLKPSPLHASPVNAQTGLPTPESPMDGETPILEKPVNKRASPPPQIQVANLDTIRDYARTFVQPNPHHNHQRDSENAPSPPKSPRLPKTRRRDTNRVSLVAGRVVQPFAIPPSTSLPPPERPELKSRTSNPSLQSFSPFRSPDSGSLSTPANIPTFSRFDSTVSIAPSTGAPSECGTPTSETAGGLGGRGIDDYVILKEAGKGAYGLVMRAKVKGPKGEPVGDEVIIKYIIKARILADCWKKHRQLGPIPVEIHIMDQLRHLLYNPPPRPHPWDPSRARSTAVELPQSRDSLDHLPNTPDSPRSDASSSTSGMFSPTQKYIASEIKHSPERGHPNICKLLDFFEDREFYYMVMPRYGTGVDLFDRVENQPDGLDPFEVRSLLGQLADAVRFLHSNGIVHRDIKDENVILDGSGRCQLIDFGSSAHWRPGKRWDTFSGTLHYASPEILRGEMYGGKEQDIWALGVVGYVLLVGETPFSELPDEVLKGLTADSSAEAALHARCGGSHRNEGREEDGGGRLEDAADFVRRCLEMELADRPNADVLCQHKYLRGEGGWTGKRGWVAMGFK